MSHAEHWIPACAGMTGIRLLSTLINNTASAHSPDAAQRYPGIAARQRRATPLFHQHYIYRRQNPASTVAKVV